MLAPLRTRSFALLWTGALISALGDRIVFIALPFVIYDLTGSALATGIMFIAETMPRLLLGAIAGVFADRWNRKTTMIVTDLLRAAVLLVLLLVHSCDRVWLIYIAAFAESAIGQFFDPAKSALLPRLISPEQVVSANALNALGFDVTRLVGPALGGMLLATAHQHDVLLADFSPGEWAEVDLDDGDNRLTVRNRLEAAATRRGLHLAFRRSSSTIVRFAIEAAPPAPIEEAPPPAAPEPEPEPQPAPKKRGRKPASAAA